MAVCCSAPSARTRADGLLLWRSTTCPWMPAAGLATRSVPRYHATQLLLLSPWDPRINNASCPSTSSGQASGIPEKVEEYEGTNGDRVTPNLDRSNALA